MHLIFQNDILTAKECAYAFVITYVNMPKSKYNKSWS